MSAICIVKRKNPEMNLEQRCVSRGKWERQRPNF